MLKRSLDFFAALIVLIICSPLLLLIALLVRWRLGSPVLFRQRRPGLNGTPFTVIKFRTMRDAVDADGNSLPDDLRLTRFGKWLRRSSLDELPELWNVLVGDMSLVGPRPLLMEYLPRYSPHQMRRHEVRPGLTGWAQVNGRNALSWPDKFDLDVWYVDNQSLWLDIKIACATVGLLFSGAGISKEGHATTDVFSGNADTEDEPNKHQAPRSTR